MFKIENIDGIFTIKNDDTSYGINKQFNNSVDLEHSVITEKYPRFIPVDVPSHCEDYPDRVIKLFDTSIGKILDLNGLYTVRSRWANGFIVCFPITQRIQLVDNQGNIVAEGRI